MEVLKSALKKHQLGEGDVLVISSKVVAITQGKVRKIKNEKEFQDLVKAEADVVIASGAKQSRRVSTGLLGPNGLARTDNPVTLTMKNNIFIPWAGIDRSNVENGYAVLWPDEPFQVAAALCQSLKKQLKIKRFGVIITDSFCVPLRRGVSGVALGYAGFLGVKDLRGKKDLFGNKLKVTQQGVADNLATAAHLVMGESDEQTPFVLIKNAPVVFTSAKIDPSETVMPKDECLFRNFFH